MTSPITSKKGYKNCNVELLINAAMQTYQKQKKPNEQFPSKIDNNQEDEGKPLDIISKEYGYKIFQQVIPQKEGGSGETSLVAITLIPIEDAATAKDSTGRPIITAFRGTTNLSDIKSDAKIAATGVADKNARDEAFRYFQETLHRFPNREHISVGHSLGGNFAAYAATKAIHDNITRRGEHSKNLKIQCRTFNTAPLFTKYQEIFKLKPELLKDFVNYRVKGDQVSKIPQQTYIGQMITVTKKKNGMAHFMSTVYDSMPMELLNTQVGHTTHVNQDEQNQKHKNRIEEAILGKIFSYESHLAGLAFSRFRPSHQNLNQLQDILLPLTKALNKPSYQQAESLIKTLDLKGDMGIKLQQTLLKLVPKTKAIELQALIPKGTVSIASEKISNSISFHEGASLTSDVKMFNHLVDDHAMSNHTQENGSYLNDKNKFQRVTEREYNNDYETNSDDEDEGNNEGEGEGQHEDNDPIQRFMGSLH